VVPEQSELAPHCTHAFDTQRGVDVGQSDAPRHWTQPGVGAVPHRTGPLPPSVLPPLPLPLPPELPLDPLEAAPSPPPTAPSTPPLLAPPPLPLPLPLPPLLAPLLLPSALASPEEAFWELSLLQWSTATAASTTGARRKKM
jgi:hypothetical protein